MTRETLKFLYDIRQAAEHVFQFVEHQRFDDYIDNAMLRSATERQCEIIGEALNQLRRHDQQVVEQIRGYRQAISFRNILIHGYAIVDDEIVWRVIQDDLPLLHEDVTILMQQENTD